MSIGFWDMLVTVRQTNRQTNKQTQAKTLSHSRKAGDKYGWTCAQTDRQYRNLYASSLLGGGILKLFLWIYQSLWFWSQTSIILSSFLHKRKSPGSLTVNLKKVDIISNIQSPHAIKCSCMSKLSCDFLVGKALCC